MHQNHFLILDWYRKGQGKVRLVLQSRSDSISGIMETGNEARSIYAHNQDKSRKPDRTAVVQFSWMY